MQFRNGKCNANICNNVAFSRRRVDVLPDFGVVLRCACPLWHFLRNSSETCDVEEASKVVDSRSLPSISIQVACVRAREVNAASVVAIYRAAFGNFQVIDRVDCVMYVDLHLRRGEWSPVIWRLRRGICSFCSCDLYRIFSNSGVPLFSLLRFFNNTSCRWLLHSLTHSHLEHSLRHFRTTLLWLPASRALFFTPSHGIWILLAPSVPFNYFIHSNDLFSCTSFCIFYTHGFASFSIVVIIVTSNNNSVLWNQSKLYIKSDRVETDFHVFPNMRMKSDWFK